MTNGQAFLASAAVGLVLFWWIDNPASFKSFVRF